MSGIELRDYQERGVREIHEAFKTHRRVCYVLPTGGGKTPVGVRVIQDFVQDGKRVLVIAHTCELVDQMVAQLLSAGLEEEAVGVIRATDKRVRRDAPVQVASVATLKNREKPPADLVVIDEAHHAPADSWRKIVAFYPTAFILGLTATPTRIDGRGLADDFDVLVHGPLFSELRAQGYLLEPRIFSHKGKAISLEDVSTQGGDYNVAELGRVMNKAKLVGDMVKTWFERAEGRRSLGFAADVKHSKSCVQAFLKAGVPAAHLDGKASESARTGILARLRWGDLRVVFNCGLFSEGWDAPEVKCIILARPTKSLTLFNQQSGRVFRPHKEFVAFDGQPQTIERIPIILDHAGNCIRLKTRPDADRIYTLSLKKGANSGRTPCKACEECAFVVLAGTAQCPNCGWEFPKPPPVVEEPGELVELEKTWTEGALKEEFAKICERARQVESVKNPEALAVHLYKLRFGKTEPWMSMQT